MFSTVNERVRCWKSISNPLFEGHKNLCLLVTNKTLCNTNDNDYSPLDLTEYDEPRKNPNWQSIWISKIMMPLEKRQKLSHLMKPEYNLLLHHTSKWRKILLQHPYQCQQYLRRFILYSHWNNIVQHLREPNYSRRLDVHRNTT